MAGITEAAVFGAAYVAMAAVGAIPNLKEPLPCMKPRRIILPDPDNRAVYSEGFSRFKDLYNRIYS